MIMKLCGIEMGDSVVLETRELFGKTEQLLREGRQLLKELSGKKTGEADRTGAQA